MSALLCALGGALGWRYRFWNPNTCIAIATLCLAVAALLPH